MILREMPRAAHGQVPNEVIEVKRSDVLAYLGRVLDPELPPGVPLHEPALRTLMFTDMANSMVDVGESPLEGVDLRALEFVAWLRSPWPRVQNR